MLGTTANAISACSGNDIPKATRESIVQLLLFVAQHVSSEQFEVVDGMDEACAIFSEQVGYHKAQQLLGGGPLS